MSIDVDSFKDALGDWVSGVTIVTSRIGALQSGDDGLCLLFCQRTASTGVVLCESSVDNRLGDSAGEVIQREHPRP